MRTLLTALCIHGLALSPALADAASPASPQAPAPKGVSQQMSQALLPIPIPVLFIGAVVVAGAVTVFAASQEDDSTTATTSTR
ncbi:hypothetical protein [Albimonas pacifica]|uniref:Uncharacterized protein n=1 Tax=Albimonas pacifica TaxID=1114924 RepID=A0A1I3INQ9_9RHOB|nr:hypothetical protein [Albimonas pacifica]SFI49614.1 hypothetical protein SAMN05216258_107154 [Albimonas pacifica]